MKYKMILAAIFTAAAVVFYTSCDKGDDIIADILEIQVTPQNTAILPGQTVQFKAIATMIDNSKEDISGRVEWRSNNSSIATIDDNGLATGVKKGFTYISAINGFNIGTTKIDIADQTSIEKAVVLQDYEDNYVGTAISDCGWTGSSASCTAGDVAPGTREKVIQRVNYFRRLCGLSDNISMRTDWNAKCQVAALMFNANNTINHYPPSSWACWHQDGYDAAGSSNIAWNIHSVNAVTAYIDDFGANNLAVGHRRWILYSRASEMGTGSSENTNSLWVLQENPVPSNPMPEFIAYPPKGYIPGPLVFDRWHFSVPGASFGGALVSMTDEAGNAVTLNIIEQSQTGVGDNSIVWEPSGINTTGDDVIYNVIVSNITGAPNAVYTYQVVIIQPTKKKKTHYEIFRENNPDVRLGDAPVMKIN